MEKLDSVIVTLALKMKDIVILIVSVKMVFFVDQIIVQHRLVLKLMLIVAINMAAKTLTLLVMSFVMMAIIMNIVYGMEETVAVVILTQIGVQLVNV